MSSFLRSTISKTRSSKRLTQLSVLISFLLSFIVIRTITNLQRFQIIPNQAGVLHIHHMVPGIALILVSGYIAISFWEHTKLRLGMALVFGVGAALTVDEYALWLFLKDVYWAEQGRQSVDAVIFVATILTILFVLSEIHDHYLIKKHFRKFLRKELSEL